MKWNITSHGTLVWQTYYRYLESKHSGRSSPPWGLYEADIRKHGVNPYLMALRSAELTDWYAAKEVWSHGDLFLTGSVYRLMRHAVIEYVLALDPNDEVSEFVETHYKELVAFAEGIIYAPEPESPSVPVDVEPPRTSPDPQEGVQPRPDVPPGGSFPLKTIIAIAAALSAILGLVSFFVPALAPIAALIKSIVSLLSGLGG